MEPFDVAMKQFDKETDGMYADLYRLFDEACFYADDLYLSNFGTDVWRPKQNVGMWIRYFEGYLYGNGLVPEIIYHISSLCRKVHEETCC